MKRFESELRRGDRLFVRDARLYVGERVEVVYEGEVYLCEGVFNSFAGCWTVVLDGKIFKG